METQFYILLSLKTIRGFENYGQYFLGNNRQAALDIFEQLKGNDDITGPCVLHMDFMETVDELPVKIRTICCTLDELGGNCKVIAKEAFRLFNLEDL